MNRRERAMIKPEAIEAAAASIAKLPEVCFTYLRSDDRQIIAIKRGEDGYYPVTTRFTVAELNKGVKPEHVAAMENGALFGWHVSGADPDHCVQLMKKYPKMRAEYAAKVST